MNHKIQLEWAFKKQVSWLWKWLTKNFQKTKRKRFWNFVFGDTIFKKLFRFYFLSIIIGACLLYLPISLNPGWVYEHNQYFWYDESKQVIAKFNFWTALFTAASGFSDTGLSINTIAYTFNIFGQAVLLLLIQFGGLGFLSILIFVWKKLTFQNKFTYEERIILLSERGNVKASGSRIILIGFIVVLISEFFGWIAMSFIFYFVPAEKPLNDVVYTAEKISHFSANDLYQNAGLSIWAGLFHSVSSANNAGFDILGGDSFAPYRNDVASLLLLISVIELIIGGIGYPIFYDLHQWVKAKRRKQIYRFSLFTKISVLCYGIVMLFGIIMFLSLEFPFRENHTLINQPNYGTKEWIMLHSPNSKVYSWGQNPDANFAWSLIYNSIGARSAGFATFNHNLLSNETKWLMIILMFIGASPASTGGGIRTTTLFVIILQLFYSAIGRKHVSIFNRSINKRVIRDSFIIFFLSILISVISVFIIAITTPIRNNNIINALFETVSAFGTVGFSIGLVPQLHITAQIYLVFLMFVGQLGISATLLSWKRQHPKKEWIRYPYEDLKVG